MKRTAHNLLQWYLAWRFLFSLKGQRFLWMLTFFGLLLVMATVGLTYTVACVAESFSQDLQKKMLVARPHIDVTLREEASDWQAVVADKAVRSVAPVIVGSLLLQVEGSQEGVEVWGVPETTTLFAAWTCQWRAEGTWRELFNVGAPAAILGSELGSDLEEALGMTATVRLVYPFNDIDPFGNPVPAEHSFAVLGTCESGVYPIDRKIVVVADTQAKRLLGEGTGRHLWIDLRDPFAVDAFVRTWAEPLYALGTVTTWKVENKTLLGAIKLERSVYGSVILLVFALASLTLYGMLSLLILEKRTDFAVLVTLGLPQSSLLGVLVRMTSFLALAGSIAGGALGVAIVFGLGHFPLPLPAAYYVRQLVVAQDVGIWAVIVSASAAVQVASAALPGIWLRRLAPVDALRFVEGGVV